jgi:tetratricopeptide (TPR) repeat protein
MEPVAWGWPLGMLAAGLLIGVALLWRMRSVPPEPAAARAVLPLELRDLDGRLDALVAQLRELEDLADKRSPDQLARERYALELQAAAALRDRERGMARLAAPAKKVKGQAAAAATVETPTGLLATRPALRGFLWGTLTAASLGALVFVVWQQAKPREQGGSATGTVPMLGRRAAPDDEMAQLTAAVAQNPDDLEARLDLAQLHLRRRDLMGVWNETQYVLAKQPGQPRALSYQALVRLAMNQPDVATSMLKQALATDPDLVEGYLHLALVYMRTGRAKEAEDTIHRASQRFPAEAPMFARVMAELRQAGTEAPLEGDPHAEVPAPGLEAAAAAPAPEAAAAPAPEAAPAAAAPPASGPGLAGVIELPEALRSRVNPGALVFLTVRDAAATEGPPVAVKRLAAVSFPLPFTVGPADSMMGQPLPARSRVEARVDSDGDPLTRVPTDPSARLDGVAAGSTRLRLVLQ